MWTHTEIGGARLEYTGRGKELLIGFLIALAIFLPVYLAFTLVSIYAETYAAFASIPLVVFFYVIGQYALWRARRYRATRTSYRGIRFWMSGSGWAYIGRVVLWDLLTLVTLGLAYPWRTAALERYKFQHTHYGTLDCRFAGTGAALFKRLWWLFTPLAALLVAAGVSAARVIASELAGEPSGNIGFLAVVPLFSILAIIAFPAFIAIRLRWWLDGIRIAEAAVSSALRKRSVYGCFGMLLLTFFGFTLAAGLAALAIAIFVGGVIIGFDAFETFAQSGSGQMIIMVGIVLYYLVMLLGFDILRKLYLDRGIWAAAANTATIENAAALESAEAAGGKASGVGEGMLDALDMGGGF